MSIQVTQPTLPPFEEYIDEIRTIWETRWLTNNGEKHNSLENSLREYLSVPYTTLFCNGHSALEIALMSLELNGEVITTPYTFASTTQAIIRCGLTPVFCDINQTDYTIDVSKIEELVTEKTTAIIPVHVYGNICNVEEIERIADKHRLKVIYDAAHAFGVKYKGQSVAQFGDFSMYSFHATKVFHTIEGGALTYSNDEYIEKLSALKNFGIGPTGTCEYIGLNAKLNEFQAAMGLCNLRHIHEEIGKRRKVFERYIDNLSNVKGITLQKESENDTERNYAYFPVLINESKFGMNRDQVFDSLARENIFARKYFYPLTSVFHCYANRFDINQTPVAEKISKQILTLPLYSEIPLTKVDEICQIIKRIASY